MKNQYGGLENGLDEMESGSFCSFPCKFLIDDNSEPNSFQLILSGMLWFHQK